MSRTLSTYNGSVLSLDVFGRRSYRLEACRIRMFAFWVNPSCGVTDSRACHTSLHSLTVDQARHDRSRHLEKVVEPIPPTATTPLRDGLFRHAQPVGDTLVPDPFGTSRRVAVPPLRRSRRCRTPARQRMLAAAYLLHFADSD
jgi:hypothetical protein